MDMDDLIREAEELYHQEIAVETNCGTYDPVEAYERSGRRSSWCNYTVYEVVGTGARRVVGYSPSRAPGHAVAINVDAMVAKLARLVELQRLINEAALRDQP